MTLDPHCFLILSSSKMSMGEVGITHPMTGQIKSFLIPNFFFLCLSIQSKKHFITSWRVKNQHIPKNVYGQKQTLPCFRPLQVYDAIMTSHDFLVSILVDMDGAS